MVPDVVFYDDRGGFSPSFLRERQVGGSEHHQNQLAAFLASRGMEVAVYHRGPPSREDGVDYHPFDVQIPRRAKNLIVIGCATIPPIDCERVWGFQVIDPRPCGGLFDHYRAANATMVCVSEWQASLFRDMGFRATSIPVPIPDEWYGMARDPVPGRFVCVSSWNKGAQATIDAWDNSWGELAVGSPYSQPADAEDICRRKGVTWLGSLIPRERWIAALASGEAVARVCTIAETFGVVDVAARAMGMPAYTYCAGDVGALEEVGSHLFSMEGWGTAIRDRWKLTSSRDVNDFRASRVLPKWLELLK
jgi:hypothetical protein